MNENMLALMKSLDGIEEADDLKGELRWGRSTRHQQASKDDRSYCEMKNAPSGLAR
jgi:hypothetical protein